MKETFQRVLEGVVTTLLVRAIIALSGRLMKRYNRARDRKSRR